MKGNKLPQNFARHLFVATLFISSLLSIPNVQAQQNNALIFDGQDQYVEAGPLLNFDGVTNNPFTIEIWFNPDVGAPEDGTLWSFGTNSGSSLRLAKIAGGNIFLEDADGLIMNAASSDAQAGRWHHAAVIYDGTEVVLYIDGVEEGRVTKSITLEGTGIRIGQSTLPSGDFWEGLLDELRIWDYAVGLEEMHSRLFTGLAGTESQLLHYFAFNELAGTTTPDLAGGLTATNFNMDNSNWELSGATEQQTLTTLGSSTWSDGSNWSIGAVPIPLDSVVVSFAEVITVDTDINVYDLNLQFSSAVNHTGFNIGISGDLSITGSTVSSNATDTVFFYGADQMISTGVNNFPVVEMNGVGVKTLSSSLSVSGDLNINAGVSLKADGFTVELLNDADWNNFGTFEPDGGTVELKGTDHVINETIFENLLLDATGRVTLTQPVAIFGSFDAGNSTTLDMGDNEVTLGIALDFDLLDTLEFQPGARFVINQFMSLFETGINESNPDYFFPTVEVQSNGGITAASNLAIYNGDSLYLTGGLYSQDFVELRFGLNSKLVVDAGSFSSESSNSFLSDGVEIIQNGGFLGFSGGDGPDNVMAADESTVGFEIFINDGETEFDNVTFDGLGGDGITFNGGNLLGFDFLVFE
ncbi:MAG: LamG domain-containing protein, partial [Bacteroidota bacterium]